MKIIGKQKLFITASILILFVTGCGKKAQENQEIPQKAVTNEAYLEKEQTKESHDTDAESIVKIYRDVYDRAAEVGAVGDLEMMRSIVEGIGEHGYAVIDEENQIDMVGSEQVLDFCEAVDKEQEAELTMIVVTSSGGLIKYDFYTVDGTVDVVRGYYQNSNGILENISTVSYPAESWQYTEEGYLLFEGSYYSESYYVLSLSAEPEHTAFRVQPLDETYRELNRMYLLPVGYGGNNLFLIDWNEQDFGNLDFYDLFEKFYGGDIYEQLAPFTSNDSLGDVYRIPAEIFEHVIESHFQLDYKELRKKATYLPEDQTYEYRPRGFYEVEYPEIPYPEVVDYTENSDGTLTLIVNAVYPEENTSRAYTHKTVVRPLNNGSFQYVSNQIIFPEGGYESWWHSDRLTEEQWKEVNKKLPEEPQKSLSAQYLLEEPESLLSEDEEKELENSALMAVMQVQEVYRNAAIEEEAPYTYTVRDFSREQRNQVVSMLGEDGYVSVTDGANMENHESVRDFYSAYLKEQDTMVTIFDVNLDGQIGVFTFIYRRGKLQTFYVQIGWREGGIPEVISTVVSDITEIKLTEKGYFIYTYKIQLYHSSLRQFWRVDPLSDRCRELTEKYLSGLSYVNYNILVTDWDSSNVEDILMPRMFEDLYRMDMGENLRPENGEIPAEVYERIMTTYLPVTKEQIREICGYHAATDSYPYEMIFSSPYPPFGEVVDAKENPDGTLTLFVDGVWPDYNSDYAFTNVITVQPFDDGTFRYLSNSIEKKELDIPTVLKNMVERE